MGKLSLGLGLGVGYVLGTRAGRARFEQIRQAAAGVMDRPEVQQALEKAKAAAPAPLQDSIEKLSHKASGSQGTSAPTGSAKATPGDAALSNPPTPPATSGD